MNFMTKNASVTSPTHIKAVVPVPMFAAVEFMAWPVVAVVSYSPSFRLTDRTVW